MQGYQIIGLVHGHTHGSPPRRYSWDGRRFGSELPGGVAVFDPDDSAAAKEDPRNPAHALGGAHGFLYAVLVDAPGADEDRLEVRSYFTRNQWSTHGWGTLWEERVVIPETPGS